MEKISHNDFTGSLWRGTVNIVYPTNNSQESATILANSLKGAFAVVQFINENDKIIYGVLCDFNKATNGTFGKTIVELNEE